MLKGVYTARKKDGTVYFRSNITFCGKHISLGSFPTEEEAHNAYQEAVALLENPAITLINFHAHTALLSYDKAVCLLNFRDNHIYFCNPIYLQKGYFRYFLDMDTELKFDIDDLFYYSSHRIQKRQGRLFVNDYGTQYSILSRYGIRPYAVAGRDYFFSNNDTNDYRYSNLVIVNHYHGVFSYEKKGKTYYKVLIHINGNFTVGTYQTETTAAIAYNKAVDLAKAAGITKNFFQNYIDSMRAKEYISVYDSVKISHRYLQYLKQADG